MGSNTPNVDVGQMALYNLDRAKMAMAGLVAKDTWDIKDTASFDCMHYLGDTAIDHAAQRLGLKPGDRVLDIGSGFSGTGRYLHKHHGVEVTGIELQEDIHRLAEEINRRNGMADGVQSVCADFLELEPGSGIGSPDYIISFLCIMHIPGRIALFTKAAQMLSGARPGAGKLYVEDFYAREELNEEAKRLLKNNVSCSYLPTLDEYQEHLREGGFRDIVVEDTSTVWADFVHQRALRYKKTPGYEPSLAAFYDTIDLLFGTGQVGGVRLTAGLANR